MPGHLSRTGDIHAGPATSCRICKQADNRHRYRKAANSGSHDEASLAGHASRNRRADARPGAHVLALAALDRDMVDGRSHLTVGVDRRVEDDVLNQVVARPLADEVPAVHARELQGDA